MKNYILLISLSFIFTFPIFSQDFKDLDNQYEKQYKAGNLDEALSLAEKLLGITEKQFEHLSPEYEKSLMNLAQVYAEKENFDKSIEYYNEVFKLQLQRIEQEYPTFASTLKSTSQMFSYMANNKSKLEVYTNSIERLKNVDTVDYSVMTDLTGYYTKAVTSQYSTPVAKTDDDLLAETKTKYGAKSDEYLALLDSLGLAYKKYVKFSEGRKVLKEAYDLRKEMKNDNSKQHAITCLNYGYLLVLSQQYKEAAIYYKEMINIWESNNFEINSDYIDGLYYYSLPFQMGEDYDKAIEVLEKAYNLILKGPGKDYMMYPTIVVATGSMARVKKDFAKSEKYFDIYRDYLIEKNDTGVGSWMSYYMGIGPVYEETGKWDKADEMYIKLNKSGIAVLDELFRSVSVSSEGQIANRFTWFKFNVDAFYSYCYSRYNENPAIAASVYNNELVVKGVILRALKTRVKQVLTSGDEELIENFYNWAEVRQKLAKLYQLPVSERKQNTILLEKEALDYETNMSHKIFEGNKGSSLIIEWKEVQKSLKPDEASIEFFNFDQFSFGQGWSDTTLYFALVLRPEYEYPKMIPLFNEKEFKGFLDRNKGENPFDQVRRLYTWYSGKYRNYYKGDSIYHYIWKPIEKYLDGVNRLYYSPSGLLHKIAFNSIPVGEDKLLIDKYSMQHMSSSGILAEETEPLEVSEKYKAMLYGGIFYDMDPNSVGNSANKFKEVDSDFFIRDRSFGWSEPLRRGGGSWSYLKGTLDEVNGIDSLFGAHNLNTTVYTKDLAVEESFKYTKGKSPEIIHIATHGFFFDEKKIERKDRYVKESEQWVQQIKADEALMRSGLLFAGANHTWRGQTQPDGVEDGILTAYEVSKMNLANTKLVVMSACETGLGDINGGEGVYGLQRAFKLAGVEYIIMSLWQIPDEQTVELMNLFYSNWLNGEDIREAFYAAQHEMSKKYEPYYWAAFVLVQ